MVEKYCKGMQKIVYISIVFICLVSCKTSQELFNKKNISTTEYKESFYITDDVPKPKPGVKYYWFKSRKVQATQSDYAGKLLDGVYTKYYYSNELAEKGNFNKGKKISIWKSWYKNGQLATTENWNSGVLNGKCVFYDSIGNVISKGKYTSGKRSGEWIFVQKGDTIDYSKKVDKEKDTLQPRFFGRLFKKKAKDSVAQEKKPGFFKRLFSKKSGNKATSKKTKNNKTKVKGNTKKETKKVKQKKIPNDKPNFFQRLFGKKEKDNT
jgi:hypothetical protein